MLQILCDNRLNILNCCILYALRTSIYVIEIFVLQTSPPPFKSSNVLHCKVWLSGVLVLLWPSAVHDAITHQFYTHCFNSVSRSDWVGQLFPSFSVSTNFVAENIIFVLSVFVFKPVTSILDFHFTVFTQTLLPLCHQDQVVCIQQLSRQNSHNSWIITCLTITNDRGFNRDPLCKGKGSGFI